MAGTHSLLAPSGSSTWARCAGALLLGKNKPDKATKDAASGTCTHWLAEQRLKHGVRPEHYLKTELNFDGFEFIVDEDRCERANAYVDAVLREPGERYVEHRLNTSPILGPPGQEGHSDCVTINPDAAVRIGDTEHVGVITVHDLKDGAGLVYARDNLQGLIYCASALYEFDLVTTINAVRFCIHQPRMHHYDEWSYSRAEIVSFIQIIQPAAKLAYDLYYGHQEFNPDIHLNPGEEQCQWCPVRGSCSARAKKQVAQFGALNQGVDKLLLNNEELAQRYLILDEIEAWCKDIRKETYTRARMGQQIPGLKMVRGRRGDRYYKNEQGATEALALHLTPDQMYEPKTLISPTKAEKLLKKELYTKVLKPYVDQPDGSLKLVKLSEPGDPVKVDTFTPIPEDEDLS